MKPLADLIRPKTLDDVVGQQHIIGENQILRKLIEVNHIPNLILLPLFFPALNTKILVYSYT